MGERHTPTLERFLHRIVEHVEGWHSRERARQTEAETERERLWAEARERERLLAEASAGEEARRRSVGEIAERHGVVFVVHSEEVARTLDAFVRERKCLVNVVPARGSYGTGAGIKGSWLVFETPEQERPLGGAGPVRASQGTNERKAST